MGDVEKLLIKGQMAKAWSQGEHC